MRSSSAITTTRRRRLQPASLSGVVLALAICGAATAGEQPVTEQASIDHNPFERPPALRAPSASGDAAPTLLAMDNLILKSVLVAGSGSQANINGRIVALGEEVVEGYRLTSVSVDGVELRRDGETIVLHLDRGATP